MRLCQCGGTVRQHGLTGEREAWTCNACGRYSVIDYGESNDKNTGASNFGQSQDGQIGSDLSD